MADAIFVLLIYLLVILAPLVIITLIFEHTPIGDALIRLVRRLTK